MSCSCVPLPIHPRTSFWEQERSNFQLVAECTYQSNPGRLQGLLELRTSPTASDQRFPPKETSRHVWGERLVIKDWPRHRAGELAEEGTFVFRSHPQKRLRNDFRDAFRKTHPCHVMIEGGFPTHIQQWDSSAV